MSSEIRFDAVVYKVQTLVDSGVRVTLDLNEGSTMQMAQLAECQRFGQVLNVICTFVNDTERKANNGRTKR